MKHLTSALILVALAGCGDDKSGDTSDPPDGGERMPQLSKWEVAIDALPFQFEGDGKITQITIGRKEYDENFANRGNVEVLFDHPEPTITIEVRKYVFGDLIDANGDGENKGAFDKLSLWAFNTTGNPKPPSAQKAENDCTKDTWKDSCAIYTYYDGKSQPERSGMDFRVHLPIGYRGKLNVETEDNIAEQSYPRRGNITIDGLCSGGDIKFEAAWAKIKMCRDLVPSPTCPADAIKTCDEWPDGSGSEAWAKECGACGDGTLFGQLLIRAPQPWAADITVDIPGTVWTNTTLQNTEINKPHACKPVIPACDEIPCTLDADDEYAPTAEFNYPSKSAPAGAGFNITVISGGCTEIPFVDDPADWKPESEGDPATDLRGELKVCTGCL